MSDLSSIASNNTQKTKVTAPLGPWTLKNPREPKVQVGVGIMKTTIYTEPTPEEYIKVRWISVSHETRSNRRV